MKLLFLIGSAAGGKMTVGQELMKLTDLPPEEAAKQIKEHFGL